MPAFLRLNQRGFASVLTVLLLVLAIGAGVLLVQTRTNFLPQAAIKEPARVIKQDPKLGIRVTESKALDQVYLLGVSKIRVSVESADYFLNKTEMQKANFIFADQIFKYARNSGLQLVIVVKPASPVEATDLTNRIGLMADEIGNYNNLVFELGNEPNARNASGLSFWTGTDDQYADFIRDASLAIRAKWPNVPIIIGALDLQGQLNSENEDAVRADLNSYLDSLSNKVELSSYRFAIHSYHTVAWFETIYNLQKDVLAKRSLSPKLWLTEVGVNLNQGDNPETLVEIIKAAETKSDIEGVIIHAFDGSDGFQLYNGSGTTPLYSAVKSFTQNNPNSVADNPRAGANGSGTTVSATDKSCGNNPVAPPSSDYVWHAFCSENDYASGHFTCSSNSDCPQNTIEAGSGVEAATSNQCVHFKEGSRCIQLRSSANYNASDPAFETPNDTWVNNPENIPFGRVGLGPNEGTGKGPRDDFSLFISSYEKKIARIKEDQRVKELLSQAEVDKQAELLAAAEKATAEAKAANEAWLADKSNTELAKQASDATKAAADAVAAAEAIRKLAKLEQLLAGGTQEQCVKADLGIRPWLFARRLKARGEDTREDGTAGDKVNRYLRLYVCSGKDSKLKWRVATEGNDNTAGEANEDSMERILHLHGDSESAPYPAPKYPFTEVQGGFVTLVGQGFDEVRFSLDKYINAAKAGKAVIE